LHFTLALLDAVAPVPPGLGAAFAAMRTTTGELVFALAVSNPAIRAWLAQGIQAALAGAIATVGLGRFESKQYGPGANSPAGSTPGASGHWKITPEELADLTQKVQKQHSFYNVEARDIIDCLDGLPGKPGVYGVGAKYGVPGYKYSGLLRNTPATIILRADGSVATIY
jgi:hypothetical protein